MSSLLSGMEEMLEGIVDGEETEGVHLSSIDSKTLKLIVSYIEQHGVCTCWLCWS